MGYKSVPARQADQLIRSCCTVLGPECQQYGIGVEEETICANALRDIATHKHGIVDISCIASLVKGPINRE